MNLYLQLPIADYINAYDIRIAVGKKRWKFLPDALFVFLIIQCESITDIFSFLSSQEINLKRKNYCAGNLYMKMIAIHPRPDLEPKFL